MTEPISQPGNFDTVAVWRPPLPDPKIFSYNLYAEELQIRDEVNFASRRFFVTLLVSIFLNSEETKVLLYC